MIKVKSLSWREIDPGRCYLGTGHGFTAQANHVFHTGQWEVLLPTGRIDVKDLVTAKAVAEAAYSEIILNCLEPTTVTMTQSQARIASGLELSLPSAARTIGPEYTVSAFMTALEHALNADQMRELSRLLDRKADELERAWRATSAPSRS